jgi:hypothetical protein
MALAPRDPYEALLSTAVQEGKPQIWPQTLPLQAAASGSWLSERKAISGPVHALGFTGALAPGHVLLVTSRDSERKLDAVVSAWGNPASSGRWLAALDPDIHVIHPGEVLQCGGVEGVACAALIDGAYEDGLLDDLVTAAARAMTPLIAPAVRIWRTPVAQASLAFQRANYIETWSLKSTAPSWGTAHASNAIAIPHGARLMTVWFLDDTTPTKVTAAASVNLYWDGGHGYWFQQPDDNCDGTGRPQISATHDVETWAIPQAARRVILQSTVVAGSAAIAVASFGWEL